jgi:hypothetical protein
MALATRSTFSITGSASLLSSKPSYKMCVSSRKTQQYKFTKGVFGSETLEALRSSRFWTLFQSYFKISRQAKPLKVPYLHVPSLGMTRTHGVDLHSRSTIIPIFNFTNINSLTQPYSEHSTRQFDFKDINSLERLNISDSQQVPDKLYVLKRPKHPLVLPPLSALDTTFSIKFLTLLWSLLRLRPRLC